MLVQIRIAFKVDVRIKFPHCMLFNCSFHRNYQSKTHIVKFEILANFVLWAIFIMFKRCEMGKIEQQTFQLFVSLFCSTLQNILWDNIICIAQKVEHKLRTLLPRFISMDLEVNNDRNLKRFRTVHLTLLICNGRRFLNAK